MARYEIKKITKNSNVNIDGVLNPTTLKENGVDVLTITNIANDINADGANKVPSVKLLKDLVKNLNIPPNGNTNNDNNNIGGSGDGNVSSEHVLEILSSTFLKNFLDEILKEKLDKISQTDILINADLTPELVGDITRENLINSNNIYIEICDDIKNYIEQLLEENAIIDEIIENELNIKYESYKQKLSNLSKNIQITTNRLAQIKADIVLEEANKHTNNIANQIVYKLEIHSSNGSSFKKGTISTVLTAVLYKGKEIVTEEFRPIMYKWTRKSHDSASDDIWNNSARRDYNIKITNKDVIGGQCTFNCEVLDEDGNRIVSAY